MKQEFLHHFSARTPHNGWWSFCINGYSIYRRFGQRVCVMWARQNLWNINSFKKKSTLTEIEVLQRPRWSCAEVLCLVQEKNIYLCLAVHHFDTILLLNANSHLITVQGVRLYFSREPFVLQWSCWEVFSYLNKLLARSAGGSWWYRVCSVEP